MTRGLQTLLFALLLVLTGTTAFAHCRPENRVWGFSEKPADFASYETAKPIDTPSENPACGYDFASGVHKYLYCKANPINGIDPLGHDMEAMGMIMGMCSAFFETVNIAGKVEANVQNIVHGAWSVRDHSIDLDQPGISTYSSYAASPNGFWVTYAPSLEESREYGNIVLYQIVSATGGGGFPANVDGSSGRPHPGQLPFQMKPFADSKISYQDSPTFSTGPFGIWTWRLTAVAVARDENGDHLLSTYYFEFDNGGRRITRRDENFREHYEEGMRRWNGN